jgi:anti-sigma factor RsiW
MTCQQITQFLADYLDGTLPIRQRAIFLVHLGLCRDCRRYLRGYRQTILAAREAGRVPGAPSPGEMPEELVSAILAARSRTNPPED